MKFSHLLSAIVGATAVFVFSKRRKPLDDSESPYSGIQKKYESHSNPRGPLAAGESEHPEGQSGSGLENGNARVGQTSDWYGNQPKLE